MKTEGEGLVAFIMWMISMSMSTNMRNMGGPAADVGGPAADAMSECTPGPP